MAENPVITPQHHSAHSDNHHEPQFSDDHSDFIDLNDPFEPDFLEELDHSLGFGSLHSTTTPNGFPSFGYSYDQSPLTTLHDSAGFPSIEKSVDLPSIDKSVDTSGFDRSADSPGSQ